MYANTLLNDAKTVLKLSSDYALAKRLEIHPNGIPEMRKGIRPIPLETVFRLAIILERDPAQVIAELEAEREKNPQRAAFWRGFLSRAAMLVATVACTLALSFSAGQGEGPAAAYSGFSRRRYCA